MNDKNQGQYFQDNRNFLPSPGNLENISWSEKNVIRGLQSLVRRYFRNQNAAHTAPAYNH